MNNTGDKLKLIGNNIEDLKTISAYCQDAVVRIQDIVYLKENDSQDSVHKFKTIGTDFINIMICIGLLILILYPIFLQNKLFGIALIGESFWPGLSIIPMIIIGYVFYGIFVLLVSNNTKNINKINSLFFFNSCNTNNLKTRKR